MSAANRKRETSAAGASRALRCMATDERRPQAAEHTQPRHRHALAEWVRDEIDVMSEGRERANAMKLAERRAARLEERLGRNHQDAHGSGDFRTES